MVLMVSTVWQVKIEKEKEQVGVLGSIGNLDPPLTRTRRGKVPNPGKENVPSFRAISTKVQEDAREQLLTGKNMV